MLAQGGSFGAQQVISVAADASVSVYAADVDGDGDMDVLSASVNDDKIAWYENTDGLGSFGAPQVITTAADGAISVYAADVDGDGDVDVLSASLFDDKIAWYENTDGLGSFGAQQVITTAAGGARSVYAADLDGDSDLDVLSASFNDNKIEWYENADGLGSFGAPKVITTAASGARSVYATDVDGDNDLDVLSASQTDGQIAWYENTDGLGAFGAQQVITTAADGARSVHATDVDDDGDMDVLSASNFDHQIAWYENTDGLGSFGAQQVITSEAISANSVYAADVDSDGDIDVLSASANDDKIAWHENLRTARLGVGCAGLLLAADAPMRVGVTSTVSMENVPSAGSFALFMLGSQALPSPFALNPSCTAYILPDLVYYLIPAVLGSAQLSVPVPANAALVGAQVAVQGTARSLDPSAWRSRWAVSNGVLYTIAN